MVRKAKKVVKRPVPQARRHEHEEIEAHEAEVEEHEEIEEVEEHEVPYDENQLIDEYGDAPKGYR